MFDAWCLVLVDFGSRVLDLRHDHSRLFAIHIKKTFYLWNQIFLSSLGCHLQLDCSSSVSSMTRDIHAKNSVSVNGQIWDRSGFPWFQSRKRPDRAIIWTSLANLDQLWTDMIPFFGQSRSTSPTLLKLNPISAII